MGAGGPFLESPGNFAGPKSNIQIKIWRIRVRVLANKPVSTYCLQSCWNLDLECKQKQLFWPSSYRVSRERAPGLEICSSPARNLASEENLFSRSFHSFGTGEVRLLKQAFLFVDEYFKLSYWFVFLKVYLMRFLNPISVRHLAKRDGDGRVLQPRGTFSSFWNFSPRHNLRTSEGDF